MIKRSFFQASAQEQVPEQKAMLQKGEKALSQLDSVVCIHGQPELISHFYHAHSFAEGATRRMIATMMTNPKHMDKWLQKGRVLLVRKMNLKLALGVMLRVDRPSSSSSSSGHTFVCALLTPSGYQLPQRFRHAPAAA